MDGADGVKARLRHLPACLVVGLTYGLGVYLGALLVEAPNELAVAFIGFFCVTAALFQFQAFVREDD